MTTIVGAAGVGKSMLALELARRLSSKFRDGAAFVSLSGLDDPRLLVSEVTRALGLVDEPASHPVDRLVWGLRGQQLLLVLDNFEQLIGAAGVVGEVSARCPQLAVLVTSRRMLNLPAEYVVRIGGLELPAAGSDAAITPAVTLFVERALAVNPQLEIDDPHIRIIGELCRSLDGLPLAIELVASHARVQSIEELAAGLRRGDEMLGLTDTIRWSYELLDDSAVELLPRLAVFCDGWSLDAMHAVCDTSGDVGGQLDALMDLIDLHLVEPNTQPNGELRFSLLETVRLFALRELERSREEPAIRAAHAEHYRSIAERVGAQLESPALAAAAAELDRELPNLRAAMMQLEAMRRWDDALAIAAGLGLFWLDHGLVTEGRGWLQRLLPQADRSTTTFAIGDAWEARFAFNDALSPPDDWDDGRGPGATALSDRLRADHTALLAGGDVSAAMRAAEHLVDLLGLRGLPDEADELVTSLVDVVNTPEAQWVKADLVLAAAVVLGEADDAARALARVEQAIDVATPAGNRRVLARATVTLAYYARSSPTEARAEVEPVYAMCLEMGDLRVASMASLNVAFLAYIEQDMATSAQWLRTTIEIASRIGWGDAMWRGLSGVMGVAQHVGRNVDAARIYGGVHAFEDLYRRRQHADVMVGYDAIVGRIAKSLGDRFETERDVGAAAGWEATIGLALSVATQIADRPATRPPRRRGPRANTELTERELDVLAQLVAGQTNHQIGDQLRISPKTVMHHTMSVYRKLGVRGRAEAVAHAVRAGLVDT